MKTSIAPLLLTLYIGNVLAGFSLFGIQFFEEKIQFKDHFPHANERFAIRLMNTLESAANGSQNVFLFPFSIGLCMTMGMAGTGGVTYSEIFHTLGFPETLSTNDIANGYRQLMPEMAKNNVSVANAILIKNGSRFVPDYLSTLQALNSTIFTNDSTTIKRINQWASENTHGKISRLISEIPPGMSAILINTIYFSSRWETHFSVSQNKLQFATSPDQSKLVDFMSALSTFKYGQFEDGEMMELPYQDKSVSMFVFLPRQNITSASTFSSLFDESTGKSLSSRIGQLKRARAIIKLEPLLKLKTNYNLKWFLMQLGIVRAFMSIADFSRMFVNATKFCVSQVLHSTVLEVNQYGTTAAAATTLFTGRISQPPPVTVSLVLNRPFLFWIRENNNRIVLFEGVINDV